MIYDLVYFIQISGTTTTTKMFRGHHIFEAECESGLSFLQLFLSAPLQKSQMRIEEV